MSQPIVIRGRYIDQAFVPQEPLPKVEGTAELIVFPGAATVPPAPTCSIFDLFGKAKTLRSAADIDAQIQEERAAWGDS